MDKNKAPIIISSAAGGTFIISLIGLNPFTLFIGAALGGATAYTISLLKDSTSIDK